MIGTGGKIRKDSADSLPEPLLRLVPEVEGVVWPSELRATCGACPLLDDPRERFSPETRCCTYHPRLWNWQVGRALRRDDAGAALVRARIEAGGGVDATGVAPPAGWRERYFSPRMGFGRDVAMRCPYWVGGAESCGIWRDRNATCRTWFCRHDDGPAGQRLWSALRAALDRAEASLGERCLRELTPPRAGDAAVWAGWFVACAAHVDSLGDIEPPEGLHELRAAIRAAADRRDVPVPACPMPAVRDQDADGSHLLLFGYSRYDPFPAPPGVVELLVRLDGHTPWQAALAGAEAVVGPLGDGLVERLWRAGLLAAD